MGFRPEGNDMKLERQTEPLDVLNCDLSGSSFNDVNLTGAVLDNVNLSGLKINNACMKKVSITDAALQGMTINGILVTELLAAYNAAK
jgi:uncharacterized protein YjbI with pentapeptide repeats